MPPRFTDGGRLDPDDAESRDSGPKSPAGAQQWTALGAPDMVPDAHDPKKYHKPFMLTTDLALIKDPLYRKISERFHKNPAQFDKAFAKAWYKLTHRDMGPHARLVGPEVKIGQLRRAAARGEMEAITAGSLLALLDVGKKKTDLNALAGLGYVPESASGRYSLDDGMTARSDAIAIAASPTTAPSNR